MNKNDHPVLKAPPLAFRRDETEVENLGWAARFSYSSSLRMIVTFSGALFHFNHYMTGRLQIELN